MGDQKSLQLRFHGRVLEHLGIQIYQSPVNSLAELVSNAWDADATKVELQLPNNAQGGQIVVRDDGVGMTFDHCQSRFLNVGWNRRGKNPAAKTPAGRRVLGRKGIGKFAGFGIAGVIQIATTSGENGERTVFRLKLSDLMGNEYISDTAARIEVTEYDPPSELGKINRGTTVTLSELSIKRVPSVSFPQSLARRFLMHQSSSGFRILVNGQPTPDGLELTDAEYVFPRDYKQNEMPAPIMNIDQSGGWGEEKIGDHSIRWRLIFHKEPVEEEELRGIAVFANGKLAQAPFFFNLSGGLSGQHGLEYLTGQVAADFIDEDPDDLIATERQRINWEHERSAPLREWGQARIKSLIQLWRDRRGEARQQALEEKVGVFADRLGKLARYEAIPIKSALRKLAQVPSIDDEQYQKLGEAILTAWEDGRLKELIMQLGDKETMTAEELLEVLIEANVLTALHVAEAVQTRVLTVANLRKRIIDHDLENNLRDYIALNPWLISPEWETFKVERGVTKLMKDAAADADMVGEKWKGRVDLALQSGRQLLILEFMRPGLALDVDHLNRFESYVDLLREAIEASTAHGFEMVTGYIIADSLTEHRGMAKRIQRLKDDGKYAMDWERLLDNAMKTWREFLKALVSRAPKDERLRALLG